MKYAHVIQYVGATQWAILEDKMNDILSVLAFRAAGHAFTAEEIQARIGGESQAAVPTKRGGVAVIPLRGCIAHRMSAMDESSGGMSAERFASMVRAAVGDDSVGTILIDADSPGGTIPGVPEAADAVFEARQSKRVVAIANSFMASACYWICSQAHEIVAIPSILEGRIGSIGTFFVHQDLSAHLEKEGIKATFIFAGKHKIDGNPLQPLSDERRAELQAMADATLAKFIKDVARGRGVSVKDVRNGFGEGRALSAIDAKAAGMIDRIETFDETIARLVGRGAPRGVGMRASALVGGSFVGGPDPASATAPMFTVGDRVVALVEHKKGMQGMPGAVNEANAGSPPYYAIDFDEPMEGGNPHKWLNEDELKAEEGAAKKKQRPMRMAAAVATTAADEELRRRLERF